MTNRQLEDRLRRAVGNTAPHDVEQVLSRCEARKGTVTTMKRTFIARRSGMIAACLALALMVSGGAVYGGNRRVASTVSLDVNPSIELTVNRREKVLSCAGLNADGQLVLADMSGGADLEGTKLNVAVNALVGALVSRGYLEDISSALLISVEDKDGDRAARLRRELTQWTDQALQQGQAQAAVLSQTVEYNAELEQKAQQNSISTGKAALVERVMALNGDLTFEELSALSVEELKDLIETGAPAMPIGKDKAAEIALIHAKLAQFNSSYWEVDAELDEPVPHYEVDIVSGGGSAEVKVHAFTGQVLEQENEREPIPQVTPGAVVTPVQPQPEPKPEPQPEPKPEPQPQPQPEPQQPATDDIGRDKALAAALAHAGLAQSAISQLEVERDFDHGRLEYEIEFKSGQMEYEYTIDAATGAVLEHEKDRDD